FQNQETVEFLRPEQSRTFSEYWIPVYDVSGVSRVSRDAVVNLERRSAPSPSLVAEVSVTRPLSGATVRLRNGGKVAFEKRVNLDPGAHFEHVIKSPVPARYTLQLVDAQGVVLLEHTEDQYATLTVEQAQQAKVVAAVGARKSEKEAAIAGEARDEETGESWAA